MRYRYALYFVPQQGSALHTLGSALLGYDSCSGKMVSDPNLLLPEGLCLETITSEPKPYGIHATVLAPFFLNNTSEQQLMKAAELFCRNAQAIILPRIALVKHRGFMALRPAQEAAAEKNSYHALQNLAADAVRHFFPLRHPADPAEIARRLQSGLTARQQAYLEQWGYPYIFEEYDFHITLTNTLQESSAHALHTLFAGYFSPVTAQPLAIDRLCVCRQAVSGKQAAGARHTGLFTVQECFFLNRTEQ